MSDADILKEAREAFQRAYDYEIVNRREAREDIEFARLSRQWPRQIEKQRLRERRPCLTVNKLAPVIRQVVNDARQNRPSIKVLPKDDKADIETAEVISGLIRNIEQTSNADVAYDTAIDQAVSGGFGYWRIDLDYAYGEAPSDLTDAGVELFEQDICIKRVANQFSVYGDPDSTAADSSDWMRSFVVEMVPHKEFKRKYPNAKMTDFSAEAWQGIEGQWRTDTAVMVAEYWKREETTKLVIGVQTENEVTIMPVADFQKLQKDDPTIEAVTQPRPVKCCKVTKYLITGAEVLETEEWPGTFIPIIPVYGDEVIFEGNRHFRSLIRDAKDANQMFNFWRTAATELVALAPKAPFIGEEGTFSVDPQKWATANTASHAFIEYKKGGNPPQRQEFAGVPAGALQEALNASDDIKAITGVYDASLGARSNETSGRAIQVRQREGDVSTFHFIDNLTRAIRHTGKVIIDLIPKVFSTPRIVRILGEDGKPQTVKVNQELDENEAQENRDAAIRIHDLRVGRYDLAVTSGPSFTTKREEAATQMIELIRSYPDAAPIIGDLLAKNLDWPGADEIAKRLEKMLPPGVRDDETGGIPPEAQQQIQQMAQAIQEMGQRLQEAESKHGIDAAKVEVDRYKAETDRLQATQQAMGPAEIQAIVMQTLHDLLSPNELPQGEGSFSGPTGQPEPEQMGA